MLHETFGSGEKSRFAYFFFFDFETFVEPETCFIVPFYAVVQKVCKICENIAFEKTSDFFIPHPEDETCDISVEPVECCGHRQYVFQRNGVSIVPEFVDFLLRQPKTVWIAHNGGRFDSIFLLRYLLVDKDIVPDTVMNGTQAMSIAINDYDITLLDSFCFLGMRLANFPKALGLPNIVKGYHPYRFTDLDYTGDIVAKHYFDVPTDKEAKDAFDAWYKEKKKNLYVMKNETYYYCVTDVDIMRMGCVKFSNELQAITKVIPFYDKTCITIALLSLKNFRTNFLKKETVGQIPATGYRRNVNRSLVAISWLSEIEEEINEQGNELQSILSSEGQREICARFVDGYCETTNTVYQFHGCFYHGCETCFSSNDFNKVVGEIFNILRERTRRFMNTLRENGYRVIEMWECEYKKKTKITEQLLGELKMRYFEVVPLNPRDALYGGRTSPACLTYDCKEGERIEYYDFTSLYPYVQKKYDYPIMHPSVYVGEACKDLKMENVFGIVKCKILPPRRLLFPVLPFRVDGKLLFALCAFKKWERCECDDEARCL